MKEFKGTKGKWYQSHRQIPNDTDGMYATQVYCKKGETIATLSWYAAPKEKGIHNGKEVVITKSYREANAKLIAAAPELLEALQSAYRCSGERNYLTKPVLDEMLSAINKALN